MEKTKLLILRVTERCNLACRYCYAYNGHSGDMDMNIVKKAIAMFTEPGQRLKIQFTGGEPLLCPELLEATAAYTKSRGIKASFSVQTNGTLLDQKSCALLKRINCAVGVSLDGIAEANSLRCYPDGSDTFNDTIKGIRALGAAGVKCNLNAVVTKQNQGSLAALIDLAAYLGNVSGVGLDMFRPLGRGKDADLSPNLARLKRDISAMLEQCASLKELGVDIHIKEADKVRFMLDRGSAGGCYCNAQTGESFAIDFNGDVYPCSSFAGMEGYRFGNVSGFIGEMDADIRELDEKCVSCGYLSLCRGGCPAGRAASAAACGGINQCDCEMHKAFIDYGRERNA